MVSAFENTAGTLADRVMAALEAGLKAGGDRRGKISAAIDSSKDPVGELRVLFDAYKAAFKIK